jgi:hypothetical protein
MFGPSPELDHFLFTFHDTTFECIAQSFSASRFDGSMGDAIRAAIGDRD